MTDTGGGEMAGVLALAVELNRGRSGNVNPLIRVLDVKNFLHLQSAARNVPLKVKARRQVVA